ncbi:zinc finger protein GAI-ASSOCIATED FACTOR 1 isoform X2 [Arachis hypogaea]|uniref:zinc finger protein GAI-ASSOCIATED FACTOR 1 isoform X2 n=1 Tax=Arachis hypogaea TaxID=3818 RepID=UPI000DED0C4A|nr:zinc finger protein GAI-ASSOCIATED FACTOR 1 isoform X2 [Arachis hypogaea]QHO40857.1 Protein indeterminate-domain [Arachis hypogaea]
MPVDLDNVSTASGEASVSSSGNQTVPSKSATKKKRNLPGMPDPDAEVIALSPKTLLATNRFVCEICNKGFQRDQNLQLHRRGHNLPWKLRQRSSKEVKKRVYVCPEPTCVHHDPSRALGDLTGIKKHFCRKHGEKKWKCDKCSKKYAVQSDWKAHSKICGTREYKCDCGTLFSRRDSFITHRAFCDALAEESARSQTHSQTTQSQIGVKVSSESDSKAVNAESSSPQPTPPPPATTPAPAPPPPPPPVQPEAPPLPATTTTTTTTTTQPNTVVVPLVLQTHNPELPENSPQIIEEPQANTALNGSCSSSTSSTSNGGTSSSVFASLFASSTASGGQERRQYAPPPQPTMSATALLQKAAQMGAAATNASLLRGLGIVSSSASSSPAQQDGLQWGQQPAEPESASVPAGLGLGLSFDSGSGLKELMMGTPSMFGPKHTTLDFLGLGMAAGGTPGGGLSALITSIGGGLDVSAAAAASFGNGEFSGKDIGRST